MISADIAGNDIVLEMPWLQQHDPAMGWSNLLWRLRKGNNATPLGHIALIDAESFHSIVNWERPTVFSNQATALHCLKANWLNNKVLAGMTIADISRVYQKYARVFDKVAANELLEHKLQDHAIGLAHTRTPLFGPLYNLSTNELKALRDYINNNLAISFI